MAWLTYNVRQKIIVRGFIESGVGCEKHRYFVESKCDSAPMMEGCF